MFVRIFIYRSALDRFENQIGLSVGSDACIDQFCDVTMSELPEHGAFAPESFGCVRAEQGEVDELDRDLPLEAAIAPPREPHAAHAAAAQPPEDPIVRNDVASDWFLELVGVRNGHLVCRHVDGWRLQEISRLAMTGQK